MQLHESILNAAIKMRATNLMNQPAGKLAKMKFHQLLVEDGMTSAIKNPEMWLRDIATKINHFVD
jgi:hypothetical protein